MAGGVKVNSAPCSPANSLLLGFSWRFSFHKGGEGTGRGGDVTEVFICIQSPRIAFRLSLNITGDSIGRAGWKPADYLPSEPWGGGGGCGTGGQEGGKERPSLYRSTLFPTVLATETRVRQPEFKPPPPPATCWVASLFSASISLPVK
ncbi:hypothetical protein HJG60_008155 [Phyllostomus discolor]|uniref:Uncharacterized protein n=1 Tax=Phyllostomus discolor TaxID=89673 RepID=A0A833Z6I2_9CHIR|nr:hypothetical protein HJG60_008155 [Phyllostomus discolor]